VSDIAPSLAAGMEKETFEIISTLFCFSRFNLHGLFRQHFLQIFKNRGHRFFALIQSRMTRSFSYGNKSASESFTENTIARKRPFFAVALTNSCQMS
jgi:hypothetical protein